MKRKKNKGHSDVVEKVSKATVKIVCVVKTICELTCLLRLRDTLYYRKSKLNLNYAKEKFLS